MKRYLVKTYSKGLGVTEVKSYSDLEAAKDAATVISLFTPGRARIYDNGTGKYIAGVWEVE